MDKKEKNNIASKKFYRNNRDEKLKYARDRYPKIREYKKNYNKKYYKEHKDYIKYMHWVNAKHRRSRKIIHDRPEFVSVHDAFDELMDAPSIEMCYYIPDQKKFCSEYESDKIAIQFD